ncbi:hypothetical protein CEXT_239681, partial [Caerostris extrusa]
MVWCNRTGFR